jgi:hypothetical protein
MISGINLSEQMDFTLPDDKDNPTTWKLGTISSYLMGQLAESGSSASKMDMMFKVAQLGIKGWTNLQGIEFKTVKDKMFGQEVEIVPMDILAKIPMPAISQVAMKILEINKIAPDERKN